MRLPLGGAFAAGEVRLPLGGMFAAGAHFRCFLCAGVVKSRTPAALLTSILFEVGRQLLVPMLVYFLGCAFSRQAQHVCFEVVFMVHLASRVKGMPR